MTSRFISIAIFASFSLLAACKSDKSAYELPTTVTETAAPVSDAGGRPQEPAPVNEELRPFTGTTEPHRKSTLTSRVSGVISKVHVREGDSVKAGDVVVSIDTSDNALRLRQAEAALKTAEVQRTTTKIEWDRSQGLLQEHVIPQSQFDAVDARMKGADAAVAQAQVAVDMAKKALVDSTVRAPYAGTITRRMVSEGEFAAVTPATPLVTIEETSVLDIRIQVPASDEALARPGRPVTLKITSLSRDVKAQISRVIPSADPRTRTFAVIIEVPNEKGELRPGLFAEARFDSAPPTSSAAATR